MQYPTQEYYVAFSIHGSHCFITANLVTDRAQISGQKVVIDGFSFTKGQSRDGSSKRNAQKLLSPELRTPNNQPMTNARDIHAFFIKLRENGWTVDDAAFIKKHKLTPVEIPAAKPVETETPKPESKTDFQTETPPGREQDDKPLYSPVGDPNRGVVPVEGLREENTAQPEPAGLSGRTSVADPPQTQEVKAAEKPAFENLDGQITAVQGDITTFEADGIVNAANAQLIPGGGVDGAINRAAGPELADAMKKIGGCPTGGADITDAFGLQTTKHIIHAVGPIYQDYAPAKAAELLESAYMRAFLVARTAGCKTLGVPLLSTGVYGYPMTEACQIAVETARQFNNGALESIDITFVAFDDAAFAAIQEALSKPSHG